MATLTIGTAETPAEGGQVADTIIFKTITGAGADTSEIAAASAGVVHVIIDGRLSAAGTETLTIDSDANIRDTLQWIVASTLTFPKGLETIAGEALKLNKTGAVVAVNGWIKYKSITRGVNIPELYTEATTVYG